jgi:leucyl/phenylalanyl-tRNA--protein transferase
MRQLQERSLSVKPKILYAEKRRFFPDPLAPTMDGIVAMGDELNPQTLLEAYSFGIFPWPHPEMPCLWFCPDKRGILDFSELHINHSLQKFMKRSMLTVTFNKCFLEVMQECAKAPRAGQSGTWITPPILKAYEQFHHQGYAHSVECWDGESLVGGLYGVFVGGVFSGESMFYKKSNASKLAFLAIIEKLRSCGLTWMDIQMITPVTEVLGGKYIDKKEFLQRLKKSKIQADDYATCFFRVVT